MTEEEIKKMSRKELQDIVLKIQRILSDKQKKELQEIFEMTKEQTEKTLQPAQARMSEEFVQKNMIQIRDWKKQIDQGELYLDVEEYEDYSSGYWDPDWMIEYYDNHGVGNKIQSMIRFAKECVDDRRYQEANEIYKWLWEMSVLTDDEYGDSVDLEMLDEHDLIDIDLKYLALLTLYTTYQSLQKNERAKGIYHYFSYSTFSKLNMEEMFWVGRESLEDTEQFWTDWIALLQEENGTTEVKLLKEAVLHCEGVEGLYQMAEKNTLVHPSLYLAVMEEYEKHHLYNEMEKVGENALEKIDRHLLIRSKIALKTAFAASCLKHQEKMMRFCWENFYSDTTVKNYLRLFGLEEMAKTYGIRGKEVLKSRLKGNPELGCRNVELQRNIMGDYEYYRLAFYTGEFDKVKKMSKNPTGSLGWSNSFIREGIRLFLLYLYDCPVPSKAAERIASYIGFPDEKNQNELLQFEIEIQRECQKLQVSEFWNYFQRWKKYFPMERAEQEKYLTWTENIVYQRADAIVSGKYRNHYSEVSGLLAIVGEIKEMMGMQGARIDIYEQYKKKFPRHSSFQRELKEYFRMG